MKKNCKQVTGAIGQTKEGMVFLSLSAVRATDQGNFDIWAPIEQPVTEMAEPGREQ
tara:strand:+ start:37 stop:204 length:168 start_codon:yes stop_codon:yes gene_type:complete